MTIGAPEIHSTRNKNDRLFSSTVFSIPNTFPDRGRSVIDIQAVKK